ncbi:putative p2X purinoceptor protein [Naja naja]|nr:putative p2X purinoceptor protein [Naja naja]
MAACCNWRSLFEYETNKVVRIYNLWYGCLKWFFHFGVLLYVSIVLFTDSRYQKKDSVISSVHVKVKGVSQTDRRVWDTAEYTIPGQFPLAKAVCTTDKSCAKGRVDPQGNGIQTGKCVKYNSTVNTCEVSAWCPVESAKDAPTPAILDRAENFTVLIKNNVHFPKFDFTTTLIKAYGIRFDILIFGTVKSKKTLLYVTFVDEPGILMIDELSDISLQSTQGRIIEKSQGDFMQSSRLPYRDWTISPQNPEELQLLQNRREGPSVRERPSWCGCGKCRPADPFQEQLCCRKTKGACITTSSLFQQLVLSRSVLEFVLLYKDPLLDLSAAGQNPFRHCAYEQYIRWRFGEGDLGDLAVIPNCCKWRIRDAFPSENRPHRPQFEVAASVP